MSENININKYKDIHKDENKEVKINVLIPDGESSAHTRAVTISLKKANKNINIIVCFNDKNINYYNNFIDKKILTNSKYTEESINKLVKKYSIDIVIPVSLEGIKDLSKFEILTKKSASPEAKYFDICKDKYKTFIFLNEINIKTPNTTLLNDLEHIDGNSIIKPRDKSGGADCHILRNNSDLIKYKNTYDDHICQEYIEGYDLGCNVFCADGEIIAHTIQKPLRSDNDFSPDYSKLLFIHDDEILKVISKLMKNMNWNGVANIDLRYDSKNNNLYVIEINPRFWATLLASTYSGINFPKIMIDYNLDNKVEINREYQEINFIHVDYKYLYNILFYKNTRSNLKIILQDPIYLLKRIQDFILKRKVL